MDFGVLNSDQDDETNVDWTKLPNEATIHIFSRLNYRDRANLSSTCTPFRRVGASPSLWTSLDISTHKFDAAAATSLVSRCVNLQKIKFCGSEAADAIIHLQAKHLREIYCDRREDDIEDETLYLIFTQNENLEKIQFVSGFMSNITSGPILSMASSCSNLKELRLSGALEVDDADVINGLASGCPNITDIGFLYSLDIDIVTLGNFAALEFLSLVGSYSNWENISQLCNKLPKLTGLDVSRTYISSSDLSELLCSSPSLKVVCAFGCPYVDVDTIETNGKVLLTYSSDIFKEISSLFPETIRSPSFVFSDWRKYSTKEDKDIDKTMLWLEWSLSHRIRGAPDSDLEGLEIETYKMEKMARLWLDLMDSSQEDVQEAGLAAFDEAVYLPESLTEEQVVEGGFIFPLLKSAESWREGMQLKAAKALRNLSAKPICAKAIVTGGGFEIVAGLVRSMNKLIGEEAACSLLNLSGIDEILPAISETGGAKTLVDLINDLSSGEEILKCVVGALANLAADDKCGTEVAAAGGVHVFVTLLEFQGVQEQAARGLANLVAHDESSTIAAEPFFQLLQSSLKGVSVSPGKDSGVSQIAPIHSNIEIADETDDLAIYPINALRIIVEGGVETLVDLLRCTSASEMTRLMAMVILANMFDGRMDKFGLLETSSENTSKTLKHIEVFLRKISSPQLLAYSGLPSSLSPSAKIEHIIFNEQEIRIVEAGQYKFSTILIGRLIGMLLNPSSMTIQSCAAFALLQFSLQAGRHDRYHASFLQNGDGVLDVLRSVTPEDALRFNARIFFMKALLQNLENLEAITEWS